MQVFLHQYVVANVQVHNTRASGSFVSRPSVVIIRKEPFNRLI